MIRFFILFFVSDVFVDLQESDEKSVDRISSSR